MAWGHIGLNCKTFAALYLLTLLTFRRYASMNEDTQDFQAWCYYQWVGNGPNRVIFQELTAAGHMRHPAYYRNRREPVFQPKA